MLTAIIVAAGRGTRMGPNVDKLFLEIAGLPIVGHTWKAFDSFPEVSELVLVVRQGMENAFTEIARSIRCSKPFRLVQGGAERQDSVWNGLNAVSPGTDFVAVQDGARPCVTYQIFNDTLSAARIVGAAVSAQKITDTIKEASANEDMISRNIDRSRLWSVQTPQIFKLQTLRAALQTVIERNLSVTDDTAACEIIGQPVKLVEARTPNPKATSPSDLPYLDLLLSQRISGSTY
ncbi:MAG: 2-C-methyl-D-erythritol 4-phosphate cytidylyltransferase [Verrucomicrobiota bacterium]|nr:2-C-methyl-D-erythritol 4-phosphate cytidylyltransferase [Verrucomicrobiota bacterium]